MNFIIKLLKSKNSTIEKLYDAILIMINRLIKYSHIISFKENSTTKQLKFIMLNKLIRYHEISKDLINDRNKFFTFNYWKILILKLKTKLKLLIIYHSQTNNQTKKINQSFKQYLRHYINNTQNNWVTLLFMTQLTLNAKIFDIIKITFFYVNYEKNLNIFEDERNQMSIKAIIQRVKTLKRIQNNIFTMQLKSTKY